jgi:hypothetical protein
MTTWSGPVYGQQMLAALLQLNHALAGPVKADQPAAAVAAAQARGRIYRVATRIVTVCSTELDIGPSTQLTGPERRSISHLLRELNHSIAATRGVLTAPAVQPDPRSTAGRLVAAGAAAGLAWDLLATRLTPDGEPAYPTGSWAAGIEARAVLTDGLLLVRGMASLDASLEPTLRAAAADPATPAPTQAALRAVAEDCQALTMLSVSSTTAAVLRSAEPLSEDHWHRIDQLTAPPSPARPGQLTTPGAGAHDADASLPRFIRHEHELTVPDLNNLAVLGSRLSSLVAPPGNNDVAADRGRDAVQAWRLVHHALSPLQSVHPQPAGYAQAPELTHWADLQLRRTRTGVPPDRDWPAAAADIAGLLPELAMAGGASLRQLDANLKILGPRTRQLFVGRKLELLGSAAVDFVKIEYVPADETLIAAALDAFDAARQAAALTQHSASASPPRPPGPTITQSAYPAALDSSANTVPSTDMDTRQPLDTQANGTRLARLAAAERAAIARTADQITNLNLATRRHDGAWSERAAGPGSPAGPHPDHSPYR